MKLYALFGLNKLTGTMVNDYDYNTGLTEYIYQYEMLMHVQSSRCSTVWWW